MKIFDKIADVFGLDPKEPVNEDSKKDEGAKPESEEKSEEKSEETPKEEPKDDTKDGAPEESPKEESGEDKPDDSTKESEEKSEETPTEESKDNTPNESEDAESIMAKAKKLIESDEKNIEDMLPCFENYIRKHPAYREVIVLASPRRKLEKRYRDRLEPGSQELLKLKEVESILKKDYDKAERDDMFKTRFKEVECYADGTPASEEDIEAWNRKAKIPAPEETPGDGSSGSDSAA
ncbi:hypothetical protein IJ103_00430 [Candidatus Saccharibacteria bacterium]|nr:hypothetical protein [Candidatus Saccharibacteria bacterium]